MNNGIPVSKNEFLPLKLENDIAYLIQSFVQFNSETDHLKRELKK